MTHSTAAPVDDDALQYDDTRRRAVAGGRTMLVRHLAWGLTSLAGSTVLIRLLGPEPWASYSVAYFLVVVFDNTFGANFLGRLVRSAEAPTSADRASAAALMQRVGWGALLLFTAIAYPASELYGRADLGWCLLAVGVCGYVYATRAASVALLERDLRYRPVAVAELTDQLTFYAIAIPLVALGAGVEAVAAALAMRGTLAAVYLRRRQPVPFLGRYDRTRARRLLEFGTPTVGAALLILLSGLVPALVLGGREAAALAFVMTSATLLGYAATVQTIAQRIGFPSLSAIVGDAARFGAAMRGTLRVTNTVLVGCIVPLGGLAGLWLPVLLGHRWDDAAPVLTAIGASFLLNGVTGIGTAALQALDRPRSALLLQGVMALTYLGLAGALIGPLDPGVAVGTANAISRGVGVLVAIALLRRERQALVTFRELAQLALALAMMYGVAALTGRDDDLAAVAASALLCTAWLRLRRGDVRMLAAAVLGRSVAVSGGAAPSALRDTPR
jgi:PST family polysaccharide transporter